VLSVYGYDALNRLQSISYPSEPVKNVGFTYDAASSACIANESFLIGRMASMTDSSGGTQFCFDRRGNMTRKVQITRGVTLVTTMKTIPRQSQTPTVRASYFRIEPTYV